MPEVWITSFFSQADFPPGLHGVAKTKLKRADWEQLNRISLNHRPLRASEQYLDGFPVSQEPVVLRRWESETKISFYQTSW